MNDINRRMFLRAGASSLIASSLTDAFLPAAQAAQLDSKGNWDTGQVCHLLPSVDDTRILLKVSLASAQDAVPYLMVGDIRVFGHMTDTRGKHWEFLAERLTPAKTYRLSLCAKSGVNLCEPWSLTTFPAASATPDHFRLMLYSCAGGNEQQTFLPIATRQRLFKRALSFAPHAAIANGDQIYWDLTAPVSSKSSARKPGAEMLAGEFDRADVVFGGTNEMVLKQVADAQIASLYGSLFRSTPMFFIQDDHDYFDNDEATDELVTFPPSYFMLQLARATQHMYYPEHLSSTTRPLGLPGSSAADRFSGISESFGTLRYGKLAEVLMYDVRRSQTMAGPSAVFVDPEVEKWLTRRTASSDAIHLLHSPSNPPGWSAGKWGEWYPDVLGADGKLTTALSKPYWQTGWLSQHDRILASIAQNKSRIPLVVSGDLHAVGLGQILRSGKLDFSQNPVNVALTGPIGTRPGGWPSGRRGIGSTPSTHLDLLEQIKPLEQHAFTIADFDRDKITLRFFKWDVNGQQVDAIDTLEPFYTRVLNRT
jgi:hypothetical protein